MRILVADDDPGTRRVISSLVGAMGHEIIAVADGEGAWEVLSAPEAPRIAVMDWNMPGLDGVEVLARLRARPAGRYTYVVLVTSRSDPSDLIAGLEAGADDFLIKPVGIDELRVRLRAGQRILALESELLRTQAYLTSVLERIDSGVVLSDAHGHTLFANPALDRLAGGASAGMTRDALLQRVMKAADIEAMVAAGEGTFEVKGPERRVVRWTSVPVESPEGAVRLDVYRDVTADIRLNEALSTLANTDHVTGLLNRRGAESALARELSRATRKGTPLGIALLDIDQFKRFNDEFGHAAGDRVLREVAAATVRCIRGYDIAVRWGGEEILIAFPGAETRVTAEVVERIRHAVQELALDGLPGVTLSAGVSELAPGEVKAEAAIERADQKLYQAKGAGRNRVAS